MKCFKKVHYSVSKYATTAWDTELWRCMWTHWSDVFEKNRQNKVWDRKGKYKVTEGMSCRKEEGRGAKEKQSLWRRSMTVFFSQERWVHGLREYTLVTHNEISNYIRNLQSDAWNIMVGMVMPENRPCFMWHSIETFSFFSVGKKLWLKKFCQLSRLSTVWSQRSNRANLLVRTMW